MQDDNVSAAMRLEEHQQAHEASHKLATDNFAAATLVLLEEQQALKEQQEAKKLRQAENLLELERLRRLQTEKDKADHIKAEPWRAALQALAVKLE